MSSVNPEEIKFLSMVAGNTNQSIGIHSNNGELNVFSLNEYQNLNLNSSFSAIECKTTDFDFKESIEIEKLYDFPMLDNGLFLDMPVHYGEGLGNDRLAKAYSIFKSHHDHNSLFSIIDFGTFVTVDFVSPKEGFVGGYIFPGLELFSKLYDQGFQLSSPSVYEALSDTAQKLPQKTPHAINGSLKKYLETITQLPQSQNVKQTFITGGGVHLIPQNLVPQNTEHLPHMNHIGLKEIYNALVQKD
ncbi:MAG: type III pantothenate kinase [Bacteriovoracaceae bacterium]